MAMNIPTRIGAAVLALALAAAGCGGSGDNAGGPQTTGAQAAAPDGGTAAR